MERAVPGNVWAGLPGELYRAERGWFATFTYSYICCNNQPPNNLIQGTRGENHLSFQVQWSEVQWLIANVFTARWRGPVEGPDICFEKGRKADNVERQRKAEPGHSLDREARHSHRLQSPRSVSALLYLGHWKSLQGTWEWLTQQVICFGLDSPRSKCWHKVVRAHCLFGR